MVNKDRLLMLVKNNEIDIDINDLDKIINIYNNLINFLLEGKKEKERFAFINKDIISNHSGASGDFDTNYYNIFSGIIKLMQCNLLYVLDPNLLTIRTEGLRRKYNIIYSTSHFIDFCLRTYRTGEDNLLNDLIRVHYNSSYRLSNKNKIYDSPNVCDTYKDVMREFDISYIKYRDNFNVFTYDRERVNYHLFLVATYLYLIKTDLINQEPYKVLRFIRYVGDNYEEILAKSQLFGMNSDTSNVQLLSYVDYIYRQYSTNVKAIK